MIQVPNPENGHMVLGAGIGKTELRGLAGKVTLRQPFAGQPGPEG